ncbi:MAG: 16S rRNA (uracil(1498)-N(3))-methyltransferase [Gammaproteobacteria bacterium]|nr:16S rRNA (uracil(1498)-N(3))-methyltransferase [Gammaproteobacteria bacterium]
MRIPRIYLPQQLFINQTSELDERAFQHCIRVLRLKQGAQLICFNGDGCEYFASIETINKKSAVININEIIENNTESGLNIHLGLGISKGERMEFAIQKAVELGVDEITPLFTEHCVVNLDEKRSLKRTQHWQGIVISACEQSGRNTIPVLNNPLTLKQWAGTIESQCLVLDPLADSSMKVIQPENKNMALVIGPEGGLSSAEISEINLKPNFHPVKFGPRILRTETAAVAAITAMQLLWGDLLE